MPKCENNLAHFYTKMFRLYNKWKLPKCIVYTMYKCLSVFLVLRILHVYTKIKLHKCETLSQKLTRVQNGNVYICIHDYGRKKNIYTRYTVCILVFKNILAVYTLHWTIGKKNLQVWMTWCKNICDLKPCILSMYWVLQGYNDK